MGVCHSEWVGYWIFWSRYTQCELMSVHYKQPVLLIEFEEHKSFSLSVSIQVTWPIRCWLTTLHIPNSTHIGTVIQVTNKLSQRVKRAFTSSNITSCVVRLSIEVDLWVDYVLVKTWKGAFSVVRISLSIESIIISCHLWKVGGQI